MRTFWQTLINGAESAAVDPASILSDGAPKSEAGAPASGSGKLASRDDHTHARITAAGYGSLNASGNSGNLLFMRDGQPMVFDVRPCPVLTAVATGKTQPTTLEVATWITDVNGKYVGCTVKGYLAQTVPPNLVALLASGVYNIFGASPAGIEFSYVMIPAS